MSISISDGGRFIDQFAILLQPFRVVVNYHLVSVLDVLTLQMIPIQRVSMALLTESSHVFLLHLECKLPIVF